MLPTSCKYVGGPHIAKKPEYLGHPRVKTISSYVHSISFFLSDRQTDTETNEQTDRNVVATKQRCA